MGKFNFLLISYWPLSVTLGNSKLAWFVLVFHQYLGSNDGSVTLPVSRTLFEDLLNKSTLSPFFKLDLSIVWYNGRFDGLKPVIVNSSFTWYLTLVL